MIESDRNVQPSNTATTALLTSMMLRLQGKVVSGMLARKISQLRPIPLAALIYSRIQRASRGGNHHRVWVSRCGGLWRFFRTRSRSAWPGASSERMPPASGATTSLARLQPHPYPNFLGMGPIAVKVTYQFFTPAPEGSEGFKKPSLLGNKLAELPVKLSG